MQPDLIARIEAAQPSDALIDDLALAIDQFLTHQVERDTLACDLTPSELTELATGLAAIAAMRGEPVGWLYEWTGPGFAYPQFRQTPLSLFRRLKAGWTVRPVYAGPTPPASGKD